MALKRIPCPECGAGLKSTSGFTVGQTVCCPKCETYFKVEEPDEENNDVEENERPRQGKSTASSSKLKISSGKKPAKTATIDDDDDDEEDDDEEDQPRGKKKKKKRRHNDDDDEERSYKNSPLRYAILGILLTVFLVLGFFLVQKYRKNHAEDTANTKPADSETPATNGPAKPGGGRPFQPVIPPGAIRPNAGAGGQTSPPVTPAEDQAGKALAKLGADVTRDPSRRVLMVELREQNIGDSVIPNLIPLANLYGLDLSLNPIADSVLEQTQGSWPKLQELTLAKTKVTDVGIALLGNSTPRLQNLDLTGDEGVTDKGIAGLAGMPITRLYITGTKATDASLEVMRKLPKLEHLYCGNRSLTDQGIANLKGMQNLERLSLADSQLTDKALVHIASLKKLDFLCLDRTKVTDAGMQYLKGLTELQTLRLAGTAVTAEGEAMLKKAIPGLTIERDEGKIY